MISPDDDVDAVDNDGDDPTFFQCASAYLLISHDDDDDDEDNDNDDVNDADDNDADDNDDDDDDNLRKLCGKVLVIDPTLPQTA